MRKGLFFLLLFCGGNGFAQNVIVEESLTETRCESKTHMTTHYKETKTILNEQGADHAHFLCSCNKQERLTSFRGQVTDASGKVIRKIKESELQRTEYSQYLAVDDYKMYFTYTPPVYPVTITYEWTVDSHDDLIEFPPFCPQSDYKVAVKKATYQLTVPKDMTVCRKTQNIQKDISVTSDEKERQVFSLELTDLPAIQQERFGRSLRERIPLAFFVPQDFQYYKTEGSLDSWNSYGKWLYSLMDGRDALPETLKAEVHQMTDGLKTDREKVERLYQYLGKTTRYVAVFLGIGGLQPALAKDVFKSGYGDCKGLSNFMHALLKEVGITSYYTTISTKNRHVFHDFASVGQMNHAVLQVPFPGDTLWLECTNPLLPMGYVHEDIAGHDAVLITPDGGELVTLPCYADSANFMGSSMKIQIDNQGKATMEMRQVAKLQQYESVLPLLYMGQDDRKRVLQETLSIPQMEIGEIEVKGNDKELQINVPSLKSQRYATISGQRMFIPVCPFYKGYGMSKDDRERTENIYVTTGYQDKDEIAIALPEGYTIEAMPKDGMIDTSFGKYSYRLKVDKDGRQVTIRYRLLLKSGIYDKAQYHEFVTFINQVASGYAQKIVLKKNSKST